MTNEELRSRYELLQQVSDGPTRTFLAMAPTRMVVMVHFLPETTTKSLLARIQNLTAADRDRILETAEVDSSAVLVTKFIADFRSLSEWLDERAPVPVDAPPPPQPPAAIKPEIIEIPADNSAAAAAAGEFTQAFGSVPAQPA